MDAVKNFVKVEVSTGYDDAATSVVMASGQAAEFPDPATANFNVVWWDSSVYPDPADDPKVEIVRVTGRSTDTLTIARGQEGTAASTKNTSGSTYKMILGVTAKIISDFDSDKLSKSLYDVNTILAADTDNTPTARTIAEQQIVGRITSGNIKGLSAAEVRTLINVADDSQANASGGTLTSALDLGENAGLFVDSALSADGKYSGIVIDGIAGTTLAFGDICSPSGTSNKWVLADANVITTASGDGRGMLGVCVLAASDTQASKFLVYGTVRADAAFPTLTINQQVFLSETAGDVTLTKPTTADSITRCLGFGTAGAGDNLFFNPSPDYITHT